MSKELILASASLSRASMLENAGLEITKAPADIDEAAVREAMKDQRPEDIAEMLARLKAEAISNANPAAYVIGADQILCFEGEIFEKPTDMEAARDSLLKLRGRTHELISAVTLAKGGEILWAHVDRATLTMRDMKPEFVGRYLAAAGEKVCQSVGAYQLEGRGVQLFSKISGDFFTILGLPLIPLLEILREKEVIPS